MVSTFSQDVSMSNHTQQHHYGHRSDPEISVLFQGIYKQKWTETPFEFTQAPAMSITINGKKNQHWAISGPVSSVSRGVELKRTE